MFGNVSKSVFVEMSAGSISNFIVPPFFLNSSHSNCFSAVYVSAISSLYGCCACGAMCEGFQ